MAISQFRNVNLDDALGISAGLLDGVPAISQPPPTAGALARHGAGAMPELTAAARAAHDALGSAIATRNNAVRQRGAAIEAATEAEKLVDRHVNGLGGRLSAMVEEGVQGAEALRASLLPDGVLPLTRPTGRPARSVLQAWVLGFPGRMAQGSPADEEVAPKLAEIERLVATFAEAIDRKDRAVHLADLAVGQLAVTRERWEIAMEDLWEAVDVVMEAQPAAIASWRRPMTEWQNAQDARAARGEVELEEIDLDEALGPDLRDAAAAPLDGAPAPTLVGPASEA